MKNENPIEEIWRIREEIAFECSHDVDRLFASMREKEKQYGDRLVHHVPRPVSQGDNAAVLREEPPSKP